ncbi:MAG: NAD(P)-dependent alcohol dehydrogenase [Phycisphaerales bacterium JB054]
MTTVHAYAASSQSAPLEPFEYDLPAIGPDDVDIRVTHCGICHSDLSCINDEWGFSQYPLVPGHEVSGVVEAVGEHVPAGKIKVGDRVGLGWHSSSCMHCRQCLSGDHNLCPTAQPTMLGRYGGFADRVRSHWVWATKLPDALDPAIVGPLLCGGITVFNPLVQLDIRPTARVGVIGIGGLGHMALAFANRWGCEVTAFTSSESKHEEAKRLGAHRVVNSRDAAAIEAEAGRHDMILNTTNANLDWGAYVNALAPRGVLHMVGAPMEPVGTPVFPLLMGQRAISGSPVGSPSTVAAMLDFVARHDIKPVTESYKLSDVNDALEHLRSNKARYRIVLEV